MARSVKEVNYMLLATKFKNEIKKATGLDNLEFRLKNITVNGQKRGCSGFIYNPDLDVYVYVITEPSVYQNLTVCRYAKDFKDYTGDINNNCFSEKELIEKTASLVTTMPHSKAVKATEDALRNSISPSEWARIAYMITGIKEEAV